MVVPVHPQQSGAGAQAVWGDAEASASQREQKSLRHHGKDFGGRGACTVWETQRDP